MTLTDLFNTEDDEKNKRILNLAYLKSKFPISTNMSVS